MPGKLFEDRGWKLLHIVRLHHSIVVVVVVVVFTHTILLDQSLLTPFMFQSSQSIIQRCLSVFPFLNFLFYSEKGFSAFCTQPVDCSTLIHQFLLARSTIHDCHLLFIRSTYHCACSLALSNRGMTRRHMQAHYFRQGFFAMSMRFWPHEVILRFTPKQTRHIMSAILMQSRKMEPLCLS